MHGHLDILDECRFTYLAHQFHFDAIMFEFFTVIKFDECIATDILSVLNKYELYWKYTQHLVLSIYLNGDLGSVWDRD